MATKREAVCGIDLGTQSCKVLVYDPQSRSVLAQASTPLDLVARADGTREQEAAWYEAALKTCFDGIDREIRAAITAIGVSGQQHGFVPLDAEGKALAPVKLWNDTSTVAECAELSAAAGGESALLAQTGLPMLPGYTAPKVLWLKKHRPDAFARLAYILLPHDYLNYLLTGDYTAEAGDASGTALFDVRARQWSRRVADLIDPVVYGCLPRLVESDERAGRVSAAAAARYGLEPGVLVSSGGGDNMMGAIGTGAVRDGTLTVSLGTSGTLYGYADRPVVDPKGRLAAFCSSTGGWLPLLCTMNCTVASERWRELLGLDVRAFDAAAAASPIGAEGLVVLPFFNGERTPNLPGARSSLQGVTAANFCAANIARAALESAIFALRGGLEAFAELGYAVRELRLTGGGSKSPLWRRIACDALNLPVRYSAQAEAAAFGAALQALWCRERAAGRPSDIAALCDEHLGRDADSVLEPDPKAAAAYELSYAEYRRYLEALAPLYA